MGEQKKQVPKSGGNFEVRVDVVCGRRCEGPVDATIPPGQPWNPSSGFNLGSKNTRIGSPSMFHGVRELEEGIFPLVAIKREGGDWRLKKVDCR